MIFQRCRVRRTTEEINLRVIDVTNHELQYFSQCPLYTVRKEAARAQILVEHRTLTDMEVLCCWINVQIVFGRLRTTRTSEVPFRECQMNAAVSEEEFGGLPYRTPLLNLIVRVWLCFHHQVHQQYQKILLQELIR